MSLLEHDLGQGANIPPNCRFEKEKKMKLTIAVPYQTCAHIFSYHSAPQSHPNPIHNPHLSIPSPLIPLPKRKEKSRKGNKSDHSLPSVDQISLHPPAQMHPPKHPWPANRPGAQSAQAPFLSPSITHPNDAQCKRGSRSKGARRQGVSVCACAHTYLLPAIRASGVLRACLIQRCDGTTYMLTSHL